MLLVDSRVGSAELAKPLRASGLSVEVVMLTYGDIAFQGQGPNGTVLEIGIELKRLGDFIQSTRSGRLQQQRLGLIDVYDRAWLLVEGTWRANSTGQLVTYGGRGKPWRVMPGKMTAAELDKQLLTYELRGGLHVRMSDSRRDTVRFLVSLYRWWTDSAFESHRSHLAIYHPDLDRFGLGSVSQCRSTLATLPRVGSSVSHAAAKRFGSIRRAVNASAEEWAEVTTMNKSGVSTRVGMKDATQIVAACLKED